MEDDASSVCTYVNLFLLAVVLFLCRGDPYYGAAGYYGAADSEDRDLDSEDEFGYYDSEDEFQFGVEEGTDEEEEGAQPPASACARPARGAGARAEPAAAG